ncbi:hypothetical protein Tco_1022716 [Tanacetum coccineum]
MRSRATDLYPLSAMAARPSGRPKRSVTKPQTMYDANVGVETGSVSKGRGRPPKSKFRKLSSQSFGRPTKVGPGTAIIVTDPHQLLAYQELKSKYEHLQSKAKEVVGVVRPYVNPEYEAFGALQELESLMGIDANVACELCALDKCQISGMQACFDESDSQLENKDSTVVGFHAHYSPESYED